MIEKDLLISKNESILVTGANGFIGSRVVASLLGFGFKNLRCFVRPSSNLNALNRIIEEANDSKIEVIKGNLLSHDDCQRATVDVSVIYHLAAGRGEKSYPNAYMNSVVTTRNLLESIAGEKDFRRFVNMSSFTVYSNSKLRRGALLDESCEMEDRPELRGEAYCYAKVRQEQLLIEYARKYGISYVILRPGVVYGPGNDGITGRVGIGTFGLFLHLGGANIIPFSYVDNCADAVVLAGVKKGIDGEIFNVVDDDLPTSRSFLRLYKKNVGHFRSLYLPKSISYLLSSLWEKYSEWSMGQLPPIFNRRRWASDWKGNTYSNEKMKKLLGWSPRVPFNEASRRFFEYSRQRRTRK